MGPRTRNTYRAAAVAFCNWCVETGRLVVNPFAKSAEGRRRRRPAPATPGADRRRTSPLARRGTPPAAVGRNDGSPGQAKRRSGCQAAGSETRRRLERLGQERALIYKTLVLTGLRKGELASLTVGQLVLDADPPFLVLDAADEKNREGLDDTPSGRSCRRPSPMARRQGDGFAGSRRERPSDSTRKPQRGNATRAMLRGERGNLVCRAAVPRCRPIRRCSPCRPGWSESLTGTWLPRHRSPGGSVPGKWKIDKRDERGRTVDVHALRHTFGTLLSKGGVAPRTAQAAMRHSTIDLTMNTYTDPKLLDVAGAMERLPALPLGAGRKRAAESPLSATGTDNLTPSPLAPTFAPTTGKPCILQSILDKIATGAEKARKPGPSP